MKTMLAVLTVVVLAACDSEPVAVPWPTDDSLTGQWSGADIALTLRELDDGTLEGCAHFIRPTGAVVTSPLTGQRAAAAVAVAANWNGWAFGGSVTVDSIVGTSTGDLWTPPTSTTFARGLHNHVCGY